MTTDFSQGSPHELREQLNAAERGASRGAGISRSADRSGGRFASVMGVLLAAYLLTVVYVYPRNIVWLDIAATAAFVIAVVAACLWYKARRRASSRGWTTRYSIGFALSAGLFGLGVALADMTDTLSLWLWLPYSLLTAAPLVIAGLMRGTR
jgi:hypothetical protein